MFYKKRYNDLKRKCDTIQRLKDTYEDSFNEFKKEKLKLQEQNKNYRQVFENWEKAVIEKERKIEQLELSRKYAEEEIAKISNQNGKLLQNQKSRAGKLGYLNKANKELQNDLNKASQIIKGLQEELKIEKRKFKPTLSELKNYEKRGRGAVKNGN